MTEENLNQEASDLETGRLSRVQALCVAADRMHELKEIIRRPLVDWKVEPIVVEYDDDEFTVHVDAWGYHFVLNIWHDGEGFCYGNSDYPLSSLCNEDVWIWQVLLYSKLGDGKKSSA